MFILKLRLGNFKFEAQSSKLGKLQLQTDLGSDWKMGREHCEVSGTLWSRTSQNMCNTTPPFVSHVILINQKKSRCQIFDGC
jgi:hypothetical protein